MTPFGADKNTVYFHVDDLSFHLTELCRFHIALARRLLARSEPNGRARSCQLSGNCQRRIISVRLDLGKIPSIFQVIAAVEPQGVR